MSRSRTQRHSRRERRTRVRALLAPKLPQPLLAVWEHLRWAFIAVCDLHETPRQLAEREYITRHEHRTRTDLIRHLEWLARRIVLVAALALNLILRPAAPGLKPKRTRKRRRILVWPSKPHAWPVRFRMTPRRAPEHRHRYIPNPAPPRVIPSMPLARRLEAVRRMLVNPERHARRFALRMARIAAENQKRNQPRLFDVAPWLDPFARRSRGAHFIDSAMQIIQPMAESAIARFNRAPEPG